MFRPPCIWKPRFKIQYTEVLTTHETSNFHWHILLDYKPSFYLAFLFLDASCVFLAKKQQESYNNFPCSKIYTSLFWFL